MSGDWRDERACAGLDGRLGFHYGDRNYDEMMCRRMCASCPVAVDCLSYAMLTEAEQGGRYRFGIWGGLTPTERTRLELSDSRYALYPTDLTVLEVRAIFEEITADMKARFIHTVDGFEGGDVVDLSNALADHYVGGGHAVPVSPAGKSAAKPADPADKGAAAPSGDK